MKKIAITILSILCLSLSVNMYAQELTEKEEQQKEQAAMKQAWKEMHVRLYELADNLDTCDEYSQTFIHPFTGTEMVRRVMGVKEGKCLYTEQMPNNGSMECKYTKEYRVAVAEYYRKLADAELSDKKVETKVEAKMSSNGEQEAKNTYLIDGKQVENPLDKAMNDDICMISGYE